MEKYDIIGMSCAACSARVEKAVSSVPGVTSCAVNLLTNSMVVEGSASPEDIISAVYQAGYGAAPARSALEKESAPEKKSEFVRLKERLLISLFFLLLLLYLSMGHRMLHLPLPPFLDAYPLRQALLQMILALTVMGIHRRFFLSGMRGVLHGAPNMDTLVSLGSSAGFLYSLVPLIQMIRLSGSNPTVLMPYLEDLYFESSAMILVLITVGKMLEARAKGKTTKALERLISLSPKSATVLYGDRELTIPIDQVSVGDIFLVRPGESIPVDGVVLEGFSAVNEASLTGESIPAEKEPGSTVSTATINVSGALRCKATHVGEDTSLAQIIRLVSDSTASKAPIARIADRVSGIFVPAVLGIAAVTVGIWLIAGQTLSFAIARGISVLVISCPCALGLATPVAIMVGNGVGAKRGILFKTAASLEEAGKCQIVVLDKTGTITQGQPNVTDIVAVNDYSEDMLLCIAASLERNSEHPLGKAVVQKALERDIAMPVVTEFRAFPGNGIFGKLKQAPYYGGSLSFIETKVSLSEQLRSSLLSLADQGKTPLLFSSDQDLIGYIAVADPIKDDSREAVRQLNDLGLRVVMLTGDLEPTAQAIAKEAGITSVYAQVLPGKKDAIIQSLQQEGKVMMVGDGINDAPALSRADIGVAIGTGTDVAVDAAEIVLMNGRLSDVPTTIRLSRETLKNIRENLFWAFFYNAICIPLAAGALIPALGWQINPMVCAAAMSLSSFCVVSNALRLNHFDHKKQKEKKKMEKILHVEGMMCPHCEARVKNALEALPEVASAVPSHEKNNVVIVLNREISEEALAKVITDQGYTVV